MCIYIFKNIDHLTLIIYPLIKSILEAWRRIQFQAYPVTKESQFLIMLIFFYCPQIDHKLSSIHHLRQNNNEICEAIFGCSDLTPIRCLLLAQKLERVHELF
jgi:hypothetical protein